MNHLLHKPPSASPHIIKLSDHISIIMPKPLKTIREDSREEWLDNEVHRHYNMPMVVVRAEPHVLMHCNVYRDTTSLLKTSAAE